MDPTEPRFNPFPGLRPFEMRDRVVFFGREAQATELLGRLRGSRFVAVVGTSGSGKSSLVRAGLLPSLFGGFMAGASPHWTVATLRPGGDPVWNLTQSLLETGVFSTGPEPEAYLHATLSRSTHGLFEAVRQSELNPGHNLLIVVDQFEEIFRYRQRSRTLEEECGGFIRLLLRSAHQQERPIYVLLTMRSDFLGECAQFGGLAHAINHGQYLIPRMDRAQIRLAIEGPVKVADGQITPRLVQKLLNDVDGHPDGLPVLQHALMRMWDLRNAEPDLPPLDLAHYAAVGGLGDALSRHLDEVFNQLPNDRHREIARDLFKALTELGPDNRGIRRPTCMAELCQIINIDKETLTAVIDPFRQPGRAFLMPPIASIGASAAQPLEPLQPLEPVGTTGHDPDPAGDAPFPRGRAAPANSFGDHTVIDISHESLMRGWARFQQWVADEAASASLFRRLAESANLHAAGRAALYQDPELQIALDWRQTQRPTPAWSRRYAPGHERAMAYLDESAAARDAALRKARRQRHLLLDTLTLIAIVFFGLWLYALHQQRIAASRLLALQAENFIGRDPRTAILLAASAVEARPSEPVAITALRRAVLEGRLRQDNWRQIEGDVAEATFIHGTGQILVAARSNAIVLSMNWPAPLRVIAAHSNLNRVAASSADGRLALTAGWDARAIVWDTASWTPVATFTGHRAEISDAAISPDTRHCVTASRDGTARIWDVTTGREASRLTSGDQPDDELSAVAFDRAGRLVALGTRGGAISVWDWRSTNLLWEIAPGAGLFPDGVTPPDPRIARVCFAPHEDSLAYVTAGGVARLHVFEPDQSSQFELRSPLRRASSIAFSRDGHLIAAAGEDRNGGIAIVWDRDQAWATALHTNRHPDFVRSAEFSADGASLLTLGDDGRVRVWDVGRRKLPRLTGHTRWAHLLPGDMAILVGDGTPELRIHRTSDGALETNLAGHAGPVAAAALAPGAGLIASVEGRRGASLRLWNARTRTPLGSVPLPSPAQSVAFSPDGQFVVVGHDQLLSIWDTGSRTHVRTVPNAHAGMVYALAFSDHGSRLVSAGEDRTATLWNSRTWTPLQSLQDHRGPVTCAAFAPGDRNRLVTASDTLRFYRRMAGKWSLTVEAQRDRAPAGDMLAVHFTPGGECLVASGIDGSVSLWNAHSGDWLGDLQPPDPAAWTIALPASDGRAIYTTGHSGWLHLSSAWEPLQRLIRDVQPDRRPLRPLLQ
jgi:WD40 repeat protein